MISGEERCLCALYRTLGRLGWMSGQAEETGVVLGEGGICKSHLPQASAEALQLNL